MLNRKKRHAKRIQRRAGRERWYHTLFDGLADVALFVPELLGLIFRGIFYVLRGLLELVGGILT